MYNKDANQTVWMHRLICAFVVHNVSVDPDQLVSLEPIRLETKLNSISSTFLKKLMCAYSFKYGKDLEQSPIQSAQIFRAYG